MSDAWEWGLARSMRVKDCLAADCGVVAWLQRDGVWPHDPGHHVHWPLDRHRNICFQRHGPPHPVLYGTAWHKPTLPHPALYDRDCCQLLVAASCRRIARQCRVGERVGPIYSTAVQAQRVGLWLSASTSSSTRSSPVIIATAPTAPHVPESTGTIYLSCATAAAPAAALCCVTRPQGQQRAHSNSFEGSRFVFVLRDLGDLLLRDAFGRRLQGARLVPRILLVSTISAPNPPDH